LLVLLPAKGSDPIEVPMVAVPDLDHL
jgi:hypothetical protein